MTRPPAIMTRALFGVVLASAWASLPAAEAAAPAAPDETVLRQRVRELRDGLRDVPLPLIIEEFSGHVVLPWQGEYRAQLVAVGDDVLNAINREGLTSARVNEAGNAVEDFVFTALGTRGFRAGRPAGPSGRMHVAGYPDLEAIGDDGATAFYVEVKTYSATTKDSTQRTFYLSPGADFKVTRDAVHLLIAVQLEPVSDGRYHATSVRWLDLSGLKCDLKHEFNANNRDLYRPESGLVILEQLAVE
jgi:hypothetical protein